MSFAEGGNLPVSIRSVLHRWQKRKNNNIICQELKEWKMDMPAEPKRRNKAALVSLTSGLLSPFVYIVYIGLILFFYLDAKKSDYTSNIEAILYVWVLIIGSIIPIVLTIVAIITGIVGLSQIRKTGEKGKGLAITGLTIGSLELLVNFGCCGFSLLSLLPVNF
jgi:hypothetical protein